MIINYNYQDHVFNDFLIFGFRTMSNFWAKTSFFFYFCNEWTRSDNLVIGPTGSGHSIPGQYYYLNQGHTVYKGV